MDRKLKEIPNKDPEISAEKKHRKNKMKKKKKNRDRHPKNDDYSEQQQHWIKKTLSATDLGDDSDKRDCGGLGLDSSSSGPQRKLRDTDLKDHSEPNDKSKSDGSEETELAGLVSTTQQKLDETDLEDHSEPKKESKSDGSDERDCAGLVSTTQQKLRVTDLKHKSKSDGSEETDFVGLMSTTQQKLHETDLEDHSEPKKSKSDSSDERDCARLVSTTQLKGNMPSRLLRPDRFAALIEQLQKLKHEKRGNARAKHFLEAVKKYDKAAEKRYNKQVRASEGFHVCQDALIGINMVPLVKPYDKNGESAHDAARFAVEMYNEEHNPEGKPMELKRVVRATWQELIRRLTIECTDGQFYEAKLLWPFWSRMNCKLIFFRPAKYYPAILCCT